MPDNALLGKPGDNNSKDINKQINETSSKDNNRIVRDARLSNMLLMRLNYRIRKARESYTARRLPSNSEIMIKYSWMLSGLFQSGEITTETSFSELIKILERSSIMKRMLHFCHVLARNAFEEFLSRQPTERAKRHKHEENRFINTKHIIQAIKESEDDEKEEGEI